MVRVIESEGGAAATYPNCSSLGRKSGGGMMGPNLDTAQTQSQNSAWDRGGLGRGRRGGKNMGGEGGSRDMPGEEGG